MMQSFFFIPTRTLIKPDQNNSIQGIQPLSGSFVLSISLLTFSLFARKHIQFYETTINRILAIANVLVKCVAIYLVCHGVKAELLYFTKECCIDIQVVNSLSSFSPRVYKSHCNKQVSKDVNEPRNGTSASDSSSAARTDDVTPDFECNIARVEDEDLMRGAQSNMSGSEYGDDFERYSVSSDEQTLPNVPPWLREAVK